MEDFDEKKNFLDGMQKNLTKSCFRRCFNLEKLDLSQSCFDLCYKKYLHTVYIVNKEIKEQAFDCDSQYALKVYREKWPLEKFYWTEELHPWGHSRDPGVPYVECDQSYLPVTMDTFNDSPVSQS